MRKTFNVSATFGLVMVSMSHSVAETGGALERRTMERPLMLSKELRATESKG